MNRREFLGSAGALAAAPAAAPAPDFAAVRRNFPRAFKETYFNAAAQHPLGLHAMRGMQRYMDFMCNGWTEGLHDFWEEGFLQVKPMYARLINAKATEIAFTGSTTIGENTLVNGMDLRGGNVVTNDLHYTDSLSNYLTRQKLGLDVRVVRNRDWDIDLKDMERVVDRNTKLIAVSLVSSVNGHLEPIKALSDLAHSHGAYLYADIIQGCGAIPIDVKAMGIDMASCAMYKWLMGEHGFGFLYAREDLIGPVVKGTLFEGHPDFNYRPWVKEPVPGSLEYVNHPSKGVGTLECGTPSVITYAAQFESFQYIEKLGIPNIRNHVRPLVGRLRKELPPLGFTCITPTGTETPIITFVSHNIVGTKNKIREANRSGRAKISLTGPNSALTVGRFGNHVRFSVSVYNNDADVDKILEVLS